MRRGVVEVNPVDDGLRRTSSVNSFRPPSTSSPLFSPLRLAHHHSSFWSSEREIDRCHMLNRFQPTHLPVLQFRWTSRSFAITAVAARGPQSGPRSMNQFLSSSSASETTSSAQPSRGDRSQRSGKPGMLLTSISVEKPSEDSFKKPRIRNSNDSINSYRHQSNQPLNQSRRSNNSGSTSSHTQQGWDTSNSLAVLKQTPNHESMSDSQVVRGKRHQRRAPVEEALPFSVAKSGKPVEASITLERILINMSKQVKQPDPQANGYTAPPSAQASRSSSKSKSDDRKVAKRDDTSESTNTGRMTSNQLQHLREIDKRKITQSSRSAFDRPLSNAGDRQIRKVDQQLQNQKSTFSRQRQSKSHDFPPISSPDTHGHGRAVSPQTSKRVQIAPSDASSAGQMQPEDEFDPGQNDDFVPTRSPYVKIVCQKNPGHTAIKKQFFNHDILVSAIWTLPPTPPSLSHPEGQQAYHVTVKNPHDLGRALKMKSSSFRIVSAHLEDEI